jgi:hypothetical protein
MDVEKMALHSMFRGNGFAYVEIPHQNRARDDNELVIAGFAAVFMQLRVVDCFGAPMFFSFFIMCFDCVHP